MPTLRELREARGWSQQELADRAKTSQENISRWETGERAPRFHQMRAVAVALAVSMDDITLEREAAPDGDTRAR